MTCPRPETLAAYQLDALPACERAALNGHIAQCADCQRELALLARTAEVLSALPPPSPPDDLWSRVAARLPVVPVRTPFAHWRRVALGFGIAASLGAILLTRQNVASLPAATRDAVPYVVHHELLTAQEPLADRASLGATLMTEDGQ